MPLQDKANKQTIVPQKLFLTCKTRKMSFIVLGKGRYPN
jgi:hypothetical protein